MNDEIRDGGRAYKTEVYNLKHFFPKVSFDSVKKKKRKGSELFENDNVHFE